MGANRQFLASSITIRVAITKSYFCYLLSVCQKQYSYEASTMFHETSLMNNILLWYKLFFLNPH